jgi:hypothetical protein
LQDVGGCSSPTDGVSFNHRELVPIDTPLFAGGFAMMVAGLPSTPAGEPAGKRCFQHIVFQVSQPGWSGCHLQRWQVQQH